MMTMHSGCSKEHGVAQNSIGHLSSASTPWWAGQGTQFPYAESVGQLKSPSAEHPCNGDQFTAAKLVQCGTEQVLGKRNSSSFTISPGNCKISEIGQKPPQPQAAFSIQTAQPDHQGCFELGFVQPVICAKYPYGDQGYGVFSTYGLQMPGRVMLPLNLSTDDGPIFVNAKQYHGIMRRRKSRAKAELEHKVVKNRKPYLHHSRHLHAMRRPRGCGGRFLNTTKTDGAEKGGSKLTKNGQVQLYQPTGSPNSEVLQSDSSNLTSPRVVNRNRSTLSGSEVTSMFSLDDLNSFPITNFRESVLTLPDVMDTRNRIVMPSKWVAATDNCCNLKV